MYASMQFIYFCFTVVDVCWGEGNGRRCGIIECGEENLCDEINMASPIIGMAEHVVVVVAACCCVVRHVNGRTGCKQARRILRENK